MNPGFAGYGIPGPTPPNAAGGLVTRLTAWAAEPFTTPMDFVAVVLTTILVGTVAFGWTKVLEHFD